MSLWRTMLAQPDELVLPWLGGNHVCSHHQRSWRIDGRQPHEYGWWRFRIDGGRRAQWVPANEPEQMPDDVGSLRRKFGYLVGSRFIGDDTPLVERFDLEGLIMSSEPAFMVPVGLGRFARVSVVYWPMLVNRHVYETRAVFYGEEFGGVAEMSVEQAYYDRATSVSALPHVTPALDLAFRFASRERVMAEERRAEEERQRELARIREEALASIGTGIGRRRTAEVDFTTAARAALAVGGAELLDAIPRARGEMVVTFRFRHRRYQCVCDKETMRVIEAGLCLTDHRDGTKGDTRFTLESLPSVYGEAMDDGVLVVWRHVD